MKRAAQPNSNATMSGIRLAIGVLVVTGALASGCTEASTDELFAAVDKGVIKVTVTLDGVPAANVTVRVMNRTGGTVGADGIEINGTVTGVTGADGSLTVSGNRVGEYTAAIVPPSGASCTPANIVVQVMREQTVAAAFTCTRGAISVLVTSAGSPVSGANVTVAGAVTKTGTTGPNGVATFADLQPGQYSVTATTAGQTCTPQSANVVAGQTTNVPVPCVPNPGSVTGQVTVNGVGESGVVVRLVKDVSTVATTTTNSSGAFQFANVVQGVYSTVMTPPVGASCPVVELTTIVVSDVATVRNFTCTRPTFPTGAQIQGNNWTFSRVRVSAIGGSCPLPLVTSGLGTMTFSSSSNTILITGAAADVPFTGTYTQSTGAYAGTGTRTFPDGTSFVADLTGNFTFGANNVPTFIGTMTRRHFVGATLVCTDVYTITATHD